MFFTTLVVFHVIVCIGLILVVLLQSSKGEGLAGSAFGGNISGAVFGGRGAATFLSKATSTLAVVFMLNCIGLAFMSAKTRNVSDGTAATSITTEKAQEDRERSVQQQQQQQALSGDTTSAIQIIDNNAAPADTSGQ